LLSANTELFRYIRCGNKRVFVRGNCKVSFINFIEWIMKRKEKVNIYVLLSILREEFGLIFDKYDITGKINDNTLLYYNNTMENIYINKDAYYDDIFADFEED
jgi:hypothetical protein